MSIELINSIIDGNYVLANQLFEERLSDIQEKKLYEVKRMFAANLNEVLGGKTRAQAEKEIRARGMVPRKASDVYGDPRQRQLPGSAPKKIKKSPATSKDDLGANLQKLGKQWKSAKFGERKAAVKMVHTAAKKFAAGETPKPAAPSTDTETPRQSWDKFKSDLTAKMDRRSAMEKKRKEFLTKNPMVAKKLAMRKVGKAVGGVATGVAQDIANAVALEE